MEDLNKRKEHLIEMERLSLSIDPLTHLYIPQMLNEPLPEVEKAL